MREYRAFALRYAREYGGKGLSRAEVEDLAHDVLERLVAQPERLARATSPAWAIIHSTRTLHYRRRKQLPTQGLETVEVPDERPTADELLEHAERVAELEVQLGALTPRQRSVLLAQAGGQSVKAWAAEHGVQAGSARILAWRARCALRGGIA